MNDLRSIDVVLPHLTNLVTAGLLPERAQGLGIRLLHRLTSPVRVALFGPMPMDRAMVLERLHGIAGEDIALFDQPEAGFDQADIALWITRDFAPEELAIWASAPDILKDHSYLVCLGTLNDHLFDCAVEEFLELVPLSLESVKNDDNVLARLLSDRVRQGRQADQDNASLFVETHKALLTNVDVAKPVARVAPPPAAAAPPPVTSQTIQPTPYSLYLTLNDQLRAHARELAGLSISEAQCDCMALLELSIATVESLSDSVTDDISDAPQDILFKEDILMAADSLVLMSLERGLGPAIDAVTTLLQIHRDVQVQMTG